MAEETKEQEKVEEKERPKKPPGFGKLKKMLKRVVNAPPMRKPL